MASCLRAFKACAMIPSSYSCAGQQPPQQGTSAFISPRYDQYGQPPSSFQGIRDDRSYSGAGQQRPQAGSSTFVSSRYGRDGPLPSMYDGHPQQIELDMRHAGTNRTTRLSCCVGCALVVLSSALVIYKELSDRLKLIPHSSYRTSHRS